MTLAKRWSFLATATTIGTLGLVASQHASADDVTVKSGDTVSQLAQDHNTTTDKIAQLNNLSNPNLIFVGETLKVSDDVAQVATQVQAQAAPATQAPAQVQSAPVQTQPVAQAQTTQVAQAPAQTQAATTSAGSGDSNSAKAWIANKESSNNYNARNGRYIGKYQLDSSYLNGDYSAANQERVADAYVQGRYGSWEKAQQFWQTNGWY